MFNIGSGERGDTWSASESSGLAATVVVLEFPRTASHYPPILARKQRSRTDRVPVSRLAQTLTKKPGSEFIEALVEKHTESDEQKDDRKNHEELDGPGEFLNAGDDFALLVGHGIASAIQKDLIVFTNFQSAAVGEKADQNGGNRSPKDQNAQKCAVNRFHGCLPPAGREQCPSADGRAGPSS